MGQNDSTTTTSTTTTTTTSNNNSNNNDNSNDYLNLDNNNRCPNCIRCRAINTTNTTSNSNHNNNNTGGNVFEGHHKTVVGLSIPPASLSSISSSWKNKFINIVSSLPSSLLLSSVSLSSLSYCGSCGMWIQSMEQQ